MKPAILCLALAVIIAVMGCSKSSPVDRELTVPLGECRTITSNYVKLCYDSLLEDSRCPINMYCIWAGTAVGQFSFYINKVKHTLTLATLDQRRRDTTVAGYKIELLELNPYPGTQPPVSKSAKVRVTKQ